MPPMAWQPGDRKVAPAQIENWYAEPLAVDGALAAPLRALVTTRVAVRAAVRGLLIRRALTQPEVLALRGAGVGPLELSQAFTALAAALPPADRQGHPLAIMIRALSRVVRTASHVEALGDEAGMVRALGEAIAHALADTLFPRVSGADDEANDLSKPLRQAVFELLTARRIAAATLDAIPPMERSLLASRMEERLPAMRAVVPPSRGDALERIVRAAGIALRRTPPIDADDLDAALAGA